MGALRQQIAALELDLQWQFVGLTPDSPRPDVQVVRYIGLDESTEVYNLRMRDAGYPDFSSSHIGNPDNYERLAIYTCAAQYPLVPAAYGLFGAAQHDFLYDYYSRCEFHCAVTVPGVSSWFSPVGRGNRKVAGRVC